MELCKLLFLLFCGHALGDFALQNEFVARNKGRPSKRFAGPHDGQHTETWWPWILSAHGAHHGLIVYLITQNLWISCAEILVHVLIDFGKGENWFGFHTDQTLHLVSKVVWALCLTYFV